MSDTKLYLHTMNDRPATLSDKGCMMHYGGRRIRLVRGYKAMRRERERALEWDKVNDVEDVWSYGHVLISLPEPE